MLKLLVSSDPSDCWASTSSAPMRPISLHIGQAVMGCGGTLEYLVDAVFNYPTFAEAYKVAALDVMNKMRTLNRFHA
jgi:NAD(P) transhydrogenase